MKIQNPRKIVDYNLDDDVVTKPKNDVVFLETNNDFQNEGENKAKASAKYKVEKKEEEKETRKQEEEKKEEEKGEEEKKEEEDKEKGEEETQKGEDMEIAEQEQQEEQSVQDTQMPPPSPPHVTITPEKTITVKDVTNKPCQNIIPLISKDVSKILDQ